MAAGPPVQSVSTGRVEKSSPAATRVLFADGTTLTNPSLAQVKQKVGV